MYVLAILSLIVSPQFMFFILDIILFLEAAIPNCHGQQSSMPHCRLPDNLNKHPTSSLVELMPIKTYIWRTNF